MKKEERLNRIIARGELTNHAHVICGEAEIERTEKGVFINCEDGKAVMKHLLETAWIEGEEKWTGEHADIEIRGDLIRHGDVMLKRVSEKRYQYIQQQEYDPFEKIIRAVKD